MHQLIFDNKIIVYNNIKILVSQIYIFIVLPLNCKDVVMNYIPIVGWIEDCDFFSNENKNDVLPTRMSPIRITVFD